MISPKPGFLSFGKVLVHLLNSSVLRTLAPYRSCRKGLMQQLASAVKCETTLFKDLQMLGLFAFLFHHLSLTWELS